MKGYMQRDTHPVEIISELW